MSTCSTATSAHHGHGRRRSSCDHDVHGGLERRLRDLEQDWDAYKTSRSAATGGTPASSPVVTGAGPDLLALGLPLRGSPRELVSSLQQAGSSDSGTASAGAVMVKQGKGQIRRYEEDASSVCSVDAGSMAASSSSCECTVPCCGCGCGCGCGYSSSSSCSSAASSLFSPLEGASVVCDHVMRKRGAEEMGRVGLFAAIAAVGVVVVGIMAMAILEFGMDEGCVEFLVPT